MKRLNRKSKQQQWLIMSTALAALFLPRCGLIVGDLPAATQGVSTAGGGQAGGSSGGSSGSSAQGGNNSSSGGSVTSGNGGRAGVDGVGGFATGAGAGTEAVGSAGAPVIITFGGAGGTTGTGDLGGAGGCDPCDCDGDGAPAADCNTGGAAAADCDDTNRFVKPGQTAYFLVPANQEIGFDYNCNGSVEQAYGKRDDCPALAATGCDVGQGFIDPVPACGEAGTLAECVAYNLTCASQTVVSAQPMPCH
ncbi:MAG TPA: hypothetical protein VGP93_16425 [Polyangiaceae bacterium]|nr:hypothetical protein [Polyangiaceae bacterium]